jgi:hypothetical protein
VLGCFLDGISIVVLTTSVVLPMVAGEAGIDLIWFGIFVVLVVEMAQITPPVGFNLFVLQGINRRPRQRHPGHRALRPPPSGSGQSPATSTGRWPTAANALVGNPPAAACLELRGLGPAAGGAPRSLRVALAGNVAATILRANGSSQPLPAWQSATLAEQDSLKIGAVAGGTAYLAFPAAAPCRASWAAARPTSAPASAASTAMHCKRATASPAAQLGQRDYRETRGEPFVHADGPIRVLLGPQAGHFTTTPLLPS